MLEFIYMLFFCDSLLLLLLLYCEVKSCSMHVAFYIFNSNVKLVRAS